MTMWFAAQANRDKTTMFFYHMMIILTLLGKQSVMVLILMDMDRVDCKDFIAHKWGIVLAKSIAILFMAVKTTSNIPKLYQLRLSAEYKNSGPKICGGIRFPFWFYIVWTTELDVFTTWVAVSIALS